MQKFIHLLYVPTMNCNMACRYCYLGENTVDHNDVACVDTLRYAVEKLRAEDVIPFNISLHGGEVTTLSREAFRGVVDYIAGYYRDNGELLRSNGFTVGRPHIKTNLFGLDRHLDTIRDYQVSVSGSLDLPFSLHRRYRVTKGGGDTLDKILANVELLRQIPNRKKVSATLFKEHLERIDELIEDIWYLHRNTCLDMNDFNFMVGFGDGAMEPLSQEEQVELFTRMQQEFTGTELQKGLDGAWFAEFTQSYCTNCDICGEKFFLLERNGDVYSCVRGQHHPDFYYGNIYRDSVAEILDTARRKIMAVHRKVGFREECGNCGYLYLCKTGCPFVKQTYGDPKSYTCLLQQKIYEKNGEAQRPEENCRYLQRLHPELAERFYIPPDPYPGIPTLEQLIAADDKLKKVYDPEAFILEVDGERIPLASQLLKKSRQFVFLTEFTPVKLYVRRDAMEALADYPVNNALVLQLLSGDTVVYGDEQREKQAHVMTHHIYLPTLAKGASDLEGYYCADLQGLLRLYYGALPEDKPNNLFFTTMALREYHYAKHKNNGFYHIRALNLPFQNIEFYYVNCDGLLDGQ